MERIQKLNQNLCMEYRQNSILVYEQYSLLIYNLDEQEDIQSYLLAKNSIQQQQIQYTFVDITNIIQEFSKYVSQILSNLQNIQSIEQNFTKLLLQTNQQQDQNNSKNQIVEKNQIEKQFQLKKGVCQEQVELSQISDIEQQDDFMEDEFNQIESYIQNFTDLILFIQDNRDDNKINFINPFKIDLNQLKVLNLKDLTLQIVIDEFCNKKYSTKCDNLKVIEDYIKEFNIPYINIQNLYLQITSYFYHYDFRRCEWYCPYDEEYSTKFNLNLERMQAQNIYTTTDLEKDNRLYVKLYFSSPEVMTKLFNILDLQYFQIRFTDQNDTNVSRIPYSNIFDADFSAFYYLTTNPNKKKIIELQRIIDIYLLLCIGINKQRFSEILYNSLNNILIDLLLN